MNQVKSMSALCENSIEMRKVRHLFFFAPSFGKCQEASQHIVKTAICDVTKGSDTWPTLQDSVIIGTLFLPLSKQVKH